MTAAYTPPVGNVADLLFQTAYTPPVGNAADLTFQGAPLGEAGQGAGNAKFSMAAVGAGLRLVSACHQPKQSSRPTATGLRIASGAGATHPYHRAKGHGPGWNLPKMPRGPSALIGDTVIPGRFAHGGTAIQTAKTPRSAIGFHAPLVRGLPIHSATAAALPFTVRGWADFGIKAKPGSGPVSFAAQVAILAELALLARELSARMKPGILAGEQDRTRFDKLGIQGIALDSKIKPGMLAESWASVAWLDGRLAVQRMRVIIGRGRHFKHGAIIPKPPPTPALTTADLVFWERQPGIGTTLIFNRLMRRSIQVKGSYRVKNTFALTRLSDGHPLPATQATVSADADSWAWTLSATLADFDSAALLTPQINEPVEVRATINGVDFDFIIETLTPSAKFGDSSTAIGGRSLTAWLDEPYAPITTRVNESERSAQQLCIDALPYGTELFWDLEDWLIPQGIFSFQGTPIRAVLRIVEAAGGCLASAKSGIGLIAMPRYPVLPWAWDDATPVAMVPHAYFASLSNPYTAHPTYNLVMVSGETAGVRDLIKRLGTAGDRPAPQIIDRLITTDAAARQRGAAALGNTGLQSLATVALPVGDELGIIPVHSLLEFDEGGGWRGLCRSVSISATLANEALSVIQTIEVERHYG